MTNSIHIDLLGTETRFVESRDYHTRVIEVCNDKPPLILLHGGGGHAETFSRNLNTLAAVCRPIAMDTQRNHVIVQQRRRRRPQRMGKTLTVLGEPKRKILA